MLHKAEEFFKNIFFYMFYQMLEKQVVFKGIHNTHNIFEGSDANHMLLLLSASNNEWTT